MAALAASGRRINDHQFNAFDLGLCIHFAFLWSIPAVHLGQYLDGTDLIRRFDLRQILSAFAMLISFSVANSKLASICFCSFSFAGFCSSATIALTSLRRARLRALAANCEPCG
jgi:hypothetical protein